ncbi:hypothetical protein SEA_MUFASA8_24 [Arthrobacter phage Mufasa8]|uniref:Uncharacterized protein n=1 Tax=Arthrobacter phage Mufasa8 TaxID=2656526 RepID=A0A649VP63_9CAUD|nr:hypothetical protein HYQ08_gp024 [Arthrobacter phage Mufasa8]QGJ93473.1 hypothetical protein SEA_MUFASA8_24 [Arthrobacter phage Mufasa8]
MAPKAKELGNQQKLDFCYDSIINGGDSTPGGLSLFQFVGTVLDRPVIRDGKKIAVIQEIADCKTLLLQQQAILAGLVTVVGKLAAAQAPNATDPVEFVELVEEGVQKALGQLTVTSTLHVDNEGGTK